MQANRTPPNRDRVALATAGLGIAALALLFVAEQRHLVEAPLAVSLMFLVWLLTLVWWDIEAMRLPDFLTLPLIAAGFIWTFVSDGDMLHAVVGAGVAYGTIWALLMYWRYRLGREGIGLGDAKLLAGSGAWLGVFSLPPVLIIASAMGLIGAMLIYLGKHKMPSVIPFGPFIAIGTWSLWCLQGLLPF